MRSKSEEIELEIGKKLLGLGYGLYSLLYISIGNRLLLKFSFYTREDIKKLKEFIDYEYASDPSGYEEYSDECTILLSGILLTNFINKLYGFN